MLNNEILLSENDPDGFETGRALFFPALIGHWCFRWNKKKEDILQIKQRRREKEKELRTWQTEWWIHIVSIVLSPFTKKNCFCFSLFLPFLFLSLFLPSLLLFPFSFSFFFSPKTKQNKICLTQSRKEEEKEEDEKTSKKKWI